MNEIFTKLQQIFGLISFNYSEVIEENENVWNINTLRKTYIMNYSTYDVLVYIFFKDFEDYLKYINRIENYFFSEGIVIRDITYRSSGIYAEMNLYIEQPSTVE